MQHTHYLFCSLLRLPFFAQDLVYNGTEMQNQSRTNVIIYTCWINSAYHLHMRLHSWYKDVPSNHCGLLFPANTIVLEFFLIGTTIVFLSSFLPCSKKALCKHKWTKQQIILYTQWFDNVCYIFIKILCKTNLMIYTTMYSIFWHIIYAWGCTYSW